MSDTPAFHGLPLRGELLEALDAAGFTTMTPVQAAALPPALDGRDVLARASTGTGKTAAFALALLQRIEAPRFRTQALVLCPTRELADQVAREVRRLAKGIANLKVLTLTGGVPIGPQFGSLERPSHVVVGTCGRVLKHLGKGSLRLDDLAVLVLDEADRMLDMGFEEELDAILEHVPGGRQTLLFSATYPEGIAAISARVQHNPAMIDVVADEQAPAIHQRWCAVERDQRDAALLAALATWGGALNLVFCAMKVDCDDLAAYLQGEGVAALALHGDLDQRERHRVLAQFANGSCTVLVATDVAARGLDIKDLDAVFNHSLPQQPEVYLHRIGRTGRAGADGVAVSLVGPRERGRLAAVDALLATDIEAVPVPAAPADGHALHALEPAMVTIEVHGGRRQKLRPGDLLGALTATGKVPGTAIGRMELHDTNSFIAVQPAHARAALKELRTRRVKGREVRARLLARV